jgi:hypothetical protein
LRSEITGQPIIVRLARGCWTDEFTWSARAWEGRTTEATVCWSAKACVYGMRSCLLVETATATWAIRRSPTRLFNVSLVQLLCIDLGRWCCGVVPVRRFRVSHSILHGRGAAALIMRGSGRSHRSMKVCRSRPRVENESFPSHSCSAEKKPVLD